jgi:hypothetical protein
MVRIGTWIIVIVLCIAMAAGVFLGGSPPPPSGGGSADAASTAVTKLTADAKARHAKMRKVATNLLSKAGGDPSKLSSTDSKLAAVQAIVDAADPATRTHWELRSMAMLFADALVQGQKLEWVSVRDAEGRREGLRATGSQLILFPLDIFVQQAKSPNPINAKAIYDAINAELTKAKQ